LGLHRGRFSTAGRRSRFASHRPRLRR
jgi:hypothetical protein